MISKSSFATIWNFEDIPIPTYLLTKKRAECLQNPQSKVNEYLKHAKSFQGNLVNHPRWVVLPFLKIALKILICRAESYLTLEHMFKDCFCYNSGI